MPRSVRASLRWLLISGIFGNTAGTILVSYQAIYLLSLGATRGEIGLLSSLSNLMMPLAMLPGAWLARRGPSYKQIVVGAAVLSRVALLGVVFLPLTHGLSPVIWGIALLSLYNFFQYLLKPAWTAVVGEIVPARWRGRYFSTRNMFIGGTAFLVLLGMGRLVGHLPIPQGYQTALAISVVTGLAATYSFSRIESRPRPTPPPTDRKRGLYLLKQRTFLAFCLTAGLWNFGVQIASPFFTVYLVDEVRVSSTVVAVVAAISSLAALPGQRVFGSLNDHKGARWVQRVTGFIIPLVPGVWGFIAHPWQAYVVEAVSAFVWAGYNLAAFNLLLEMTPEEGRPSAVAVYQAVSGIGMTLGAAAGGWVAQQYGYRPVFLLSAGGRLLAAAMFSLVVVRAVSWPQFPRPKFLRRKRRLERVDPMTTRIILTRHGRTIWNHEGRFRGQADPPLDEVGVQQAEAAAQAILARWTPEAVYCSSLRRARQTAEAVAKPLGLTVRPVRGLLDINYGAWAGLTLDEVRAKWPDALRAWLERPHEVIIPDGETLAEVRQRGVDTLREIAQLHQGQTVVVVGHTVINRLMLLGVLDIGNEHFWHLGQDVAAINVLTCKEGAFTLHKLNDTHHLDEIGGHNGT